MALTLKKLGSVQCDDGGNTLVVVGGNMKVNG